MNKSDNKRAGVLVCFAMKEEAAAFRKMSTSLPGLRVLLTGVGQRNAERAIREAVDAGKPELVISSGFAGGLHPDLCLGDILFDVDRAAHLESALQIAGAKPARFHCSERIATSAAEKRALQASTGADAVEMESLIIHQVCAERNVPCATVRIVLDTASENLPLDFNRLMNERQEMDYLKLGLAVVRSPAVLPALMKLQRQTRLAAADLGRFLVRVLPQMASAK
jgi:adenosylhomocysteine nucleosidase